MTNTEAVEWLKYNRDELLRYADTIDVLGGVYESDLKPTIEALDMAISALEKQEGKKPQIVRNEFSRKDEDWNDYICPKCGRPFMSKINGEWFCGKRQNFCDLCGQRIDWSDEHGTD